MTKIDPKSSHLLHFEPEPEETEYEGFDEFPEEQELDFNDIYGRNGFRIVSDPDSEYSESDYE